MIQYEAAGDVRRFWVMRALKALGLMVVLAGPACPIDDGVVDGGANEDEGEGEAVDAFGYRRCPADQEEAATATSSCVIHFDDAACPLLRADAEGPCTALGLFCTWCTADGESISTFCSDETGQWTASIGC